MEQDFDHSLALSGSERKQHEISATQLWIRRSWYESTQLYQRRRGHSLIIFDEKDAGRYAPLLVGSWRRGSD
jgi:hypothetical protein